MSRKHEAKLSSRKFWLTIYSVILFPVLLWMGWIDGSHFVALYPMTLGLYFGGNVWQKRIDSTYDYSDQSAGDYWQSYRDRRGGHVQVSESGQGVSQGSADPDDWRP